MVIVNVRYFKLSSLLLLFYVVVWCCVSVDAQCEPDAVPCRDDCTPSPVCCFSMDEETEVGVVVGNVNIVTEIKDALTSPSHSIEVIDVTEFLVNTSTGEVQVNTRVDRESGMSCITIPVRLNGPNGLSLINVGAVVADINDHSPEFPVDSHSEERQEEMELEFCIEQITQLEASDRDIGPNGNITYSLGGDAASNFEIVFNDDEDSYCIQSTGLLDREEVADPSNTRVYSLTLVLIASDSGTPPRHDNMTFTINLTDINDNSPAFTKESLEPVTVLENRTDGVIRILNATDQDYNNKLEYSLDFSSESAPFEVDLNTGQLSVAATAKLNLNGYNLTIIVSDSMQSTPETLIVNVLDVNERAIIKLFGRHPQVYEEHLLDNPFRYHIDDPDTSSPDNYLVELLGPYKDRFSYSISDDPLLLITIQLISPIDQEALIEETGNSSIVLGFRVTEVGLNNHTHDLEINIPIIGINDNPPMLRETVFNIEEEQPSGSRVVELMGYDLDDGNDGEVVSFCFISAEAHPNNQDLTTTFLMFSENMNCEDSSLLAPKLDRDESGIENITVIMELTDGGGLSNRVTVTIFVKDINDNYPYFPQAVYEFKFEEGEVNVTGGPFEATDADIGSNADIRYKLLDHHEEFSVDNITGIVRTKVVFDREKQDKYTIHIRAVNVVSVKENTVIVRDVAEVQVTVIDVNDNPPVWENTLTTVTIISDSSVGTFVTSLTATDADIGDNAEVSYKLDPSKLFDITTDNGIIRVKANLENEIGSHNVLVTAFNTHDPEQSNPRNITIIVKEPSSSHPTPLGVIVGSITGFVIIVAAVVILMLVALLWVYWNKRRHKRWLEKRRSDIIDGMTTRSILRPIPSSSVEFNGRSSSVNGKGREVKFDTNVQEYGYDDEHAVSNSSNVRYSEFTIRPDSSGDESPATPPRLPSASLHHNGKLPSENFSHVSNGAPRLPSSKDAFLYAHHPHPIHEDNFYNEDSESDDDSTLQDNASTTNGPIPIVRLPPRMGPSPHSPPATTHLPPMPLMVPSHPFTRSPNHSATLTPPDNDRLSSQSSSLDSLTNTPPRAHSHLSHENQHNRQSPRGPYPRHMPDGYIPPPSSTAVTARFGATSFLDHFQGTDFEDTSTYASADLDEELKFHPEQTPSIYRLTTTSYDEESQL